MASATGSGYEKTSAAAPAMSAEAYRVQLSCLMFLRGIRHGRFHLATALQGAGAFGDVALHLHGQDGPSETFLIQARSGRSTGGVLGRPALFSLSPEPHGDLSLLKQFVSHRDNTAKSTKIGHQTFDTPPEDCTLVLYTDARLRAQKVASYPHQEILNSIPEGLVTSFSEGRDLDVFNCARHLQEYLQLLRQIQAQSGVVEDVATSIIEDVSCFLVDHDGEMNENLWQMANRLMDNAGERELRNQIKLISDLGDLQGYYSFVRRFVLCTSQASEMELQVAIRQELGNTLGISSEHSAIIYRGLQDKIQKWCGESQGVFLTEDSPLWDETVREGLQLMSEDMLRIVRNLDIGFCDAETDRLRTKMGDARVVVCVAEGDSTTLSTCKVVQTLEQDRCRFVVGQNDASLHYWLSPWCPTLVTEFLEADPTVVSTLCSVVEHCPDKRLIVVVSRSQLANIGGVRDLPYCVEVEDDTNLASLDDATQRQVLSVQVNFQGQHVTLKELINGKETLKKAITAEFLLEFLHGDSMFLGEPLEETVSFYIPRSLQRVDLVHRDLIRGLFRCEGPIFAVSGVTEEELQQLVPAGEPVRSLDHYLRPECRFYVVDDVTDLAPLKERTAELVHLSKDDYGFRVRSWAGGTGFNCFLDDSMHSTVRPGTVWDLPERVVVISGRSGIGKSTLLSHVAQNTKLEEPSTWVVRAGLNSMASYLDTIGAITKASAVHFLAVAAGIIDTFEMLLLQDSVDETGRIVVLLDDFDEILPHHKEQVISIVAVLLRTNVANVWIASRRKERLEQVLSTIAFDVTEFSASERRSLLSGVWCECFPGEDRTRLETYVSEALRLAADSLFATDVVGTPLLTVFIANIYERALQGNLPDAPSPRKMNIVELYEEFFRQRCLSYAEEISDNSQGAASELGEDWRKEIEDRHISAALLLYFTREDLETLSDESLIESGMKYLENGIQEWSRLGIIRSENYGTPQFLHRSIMEFLVAKWLARNYHRNLEFIQEKLFTDDYSVVRIMFDIMLAERSPLHTAVLNGDVETLKQTLDVVQVDSRDRGGRTLLHVSVIADWKNATVATEVLDLLLSRGADVETSDYVMEWSSMEYASHTGNFRALGVILRERRHCARLVSTEVRPNEAFLVACRYGYLEMLHVLLQQHPDVGAKRDEHRRTALHVAAEHRQPDVVRYLLQGDVEVNAGDLNGATALHVTAESGDVDVAQCLLQAGADVGARDCASSTALHVCAASGHLGVFQLLLEAGADADAVDADGFTPLDLAYENGHTEIVRRLNNDDDNDDSPHLAHVSWPSTLFDNSDVYKPVYMTSAEDHSKVVRSLEEEGGVTATKTRPDTIPDITVSDFTRYTPTGQKSENSHTDAVNYSDYDYPETEPFSVPKPFRDTWNSTNVIDSTKQTTPDLSSENGHNELVKYFEKDDETTEFLEVEIPLRDSWTETTVSNSTGHAPVVTLPSPNEHSEDGKGLEKDDEKSEPLTLVEPFIGSWTDTTTVNSTDDAHFVRLTSTIGNSEVDKNVKKDDDKLGHLNVSEPFPDSWTDTTIVNSTRDPPFVTLPSSNGPSEVGKALQKDDDKSGRLTFEEPSTDYWTDTTIVNSTGDAPFVTLPFTNDHSEVNKDIQKDDDKYGRLALSELFTDSWTDTTIVNSTRDPPFVTLPSSNGPSEVGKALQKDDDKSGRLTFEEPSTDYWTDTTIVNSTGDAPFVTLPFTNDHSEVNKDIQKDDDKYGRLALSELFTDSWTDTTIVNSTGDPSSVSLTSPSGRSEIGKSIEKDDDEPRHLSVVSGPFIDSWAETTVANSTEHAPFVTLPNDHFEFVKRLEKDDNKSEHLTASEHFQGSWTDTTIVNSTGDASFELLSSPNDQVEVRKSLENNHDRSEQLSVEERDSWAATKVVDSTIHLDLASSTGHAKDSDSSEDDGGTTELPVAKPLRNPLALMADINSTGPASRGPLATENRYSDYNNSWQDDDDRTRQISVWEPFLDSAEDTTIESTTEHKALAPASTKYDYKGEDSSSLEEYDDARRGLAKAEKPLDARSDTSNTDSSDSSSLEEPLTKDLTNTSSSPGQNGTKDVGPLFEAVAHGHVSAVKFFLTNGIDVDSPDERKRTPLHIAALNGHLDVAQLLLENGCTLDVKDRQEKTPLYYAIDHGRLDIARFLIEEGHTVYATDKDRRTPLHCAVIHHNVDIVRMLLEEGCQVNAVDCNQDTPLHFAAIYGHSDILKLLIEEGSWVDAFNKDNRSPLHYAAMQGHLDNVRILIDNGGTVDATDKDEDTPLHDAARQGYLGIVELLIENGSEVSPVNKTKQTPMQCASKEGHMDVFHFLSKRSKSNSTEAIGQSSVLELLAEKDDKVDGVDGVDETNGHPLHRAAMEGHLNVTNALIDKGSDVDAIDEDNRTALHLAALEGHLDIVKSLIENGSAVGSLDILKRTPLHYSTMEGHFDIVKILIDEGSSVNAIDKDKATPLHFAATQGYLNIVELLVKRASTVDALDKDGMTPLHFAAMEDHLSIVRFLVQKGSSVNTQNKELITPLHYATSCGNVDMIHFLIQNGSALNSIDEDRKTPLHYAIVNNDVDVTRILIENGCSVAAVDSDNDTPVHYAAMMGYSDVVKVLVEKGSAVDPINNDNDTPLNYAARQGHLEIVRFLVEMGSKLESPDDGPLHDAAKNGRLEIARFLIERGSDVGAVNSNRNTPLHYACMQGHVDVVRLLVEKGCPLNPLDENHDTPLHFAAMQGNIETVRVLVGNGSRVDYLDKDGRTPMDVAVQNGFEDVVAYLESNGVAVVHCKDAKRKPWCCRILCGSE